MRRSKQIVFYGIMVVMTLAAIEGMAQAAYYIAYREFHGAGPALLPAAPDAAAKAAAARAFTAGNRMSHPYYGFTRAYADAALNQTPPPRREDGVVLIALLGGSVAWQTAPFFRNALATWFQANGIPLRPVVLELSHLGWKQPQQMIAIANTLALGGEYDIIVNLDGYNELALTQRVHFNYNQAPFFPRLWRRALVNTNTEKLLVSRIYAMRQRQQRLDARAVAEPWSRSALYGIVNRYLRTRTAAQIQALNHDLDQIPAEYALESHGPIWAAEPDDGAAPDLYDLSRIALRVWYRSSVLMAGLSRDAGAEYYHFLQPNQYVPDSKPLTAEELDIAYDPAGWSARAYRAAYPLLLRLGGELRQQGINYHDLTQIFADNRETLYVDDCCHLNARGSELLAANMVQRLALALRNRAALAEARVGGEGGMTSGTALDAAVREVSPVHAVNKQWFDVRLTADGKLRYAREGCRPADTADPFFVQITPADAVDLMPAGAESGYNRHDFSFDGDGGTRDSDGRCVVEYELPGYAVADVVTGQYAPETGRQLWRARLTLDWGFAVELAGAGMLRYSRDNCRPVHLAARFFLHITPADAADLAPGRAEHGYDNYDFPGLGEADGIIDAAGRCEVERELPDYEIASILTGQYIPAVGRRLWETRVDLGQP